MAMGSKAGGSRYIPELQYLRFLAAFLVLFGHVGLNLHERGTISDETYVRFDAYPWGSGVDVFFVISGFVIFLVARDLRGGAGAALGFMRDRLVRIAPIYWFYTALMLLAMALFAGRVTNATIDPAHVLASLAFIPWPHPDNGYLRPVLAQGWTLNYEMYFYLVVAATILLGVRRRGLAASVLIIALLLVGQIRAEGEPGTYFLGYDIVLEFLYGIALCQLWHRGVRVPGWCTWPAIAASLILLGVMGTFTSLPRSVAFGIPAALMVAAVTLTWHDPARRTMRTLGELGNASYSLYLSHPFVIAGILLVVDRLGIAAISESWPLLLALICIASVAFSVVSYRLIERPMMTLFRRPGRLRSPAPMDRTV